MMCSKHASLLMMAILLALTGLAGCRSSAPKQPAAPRLDPVIPVRQTPTGTIRIIMIVPGQDEGLLVTLDDRTYTDLAKFQKDLAASHRKKPDVSTLVRIPLGEETSDPVRQVLMCVRAAGIEKIIHAPYVPEK